MRTRLAAVPVALAAAVLLTAGSCEQRDPCRNVPKADPAVVAAVADHPEYELEVEGENEAECVLTRSGRWADETDG